MNHDEMMGVPSAPAATPHAMRFTGSGGEYFGIWIVNLLLTILTLGIYSAWAKVRRLQYFYRHTRLADASFDFHGKPRSILVGRLVALGLLIAYSYGTRHPSALSIAIVAAIALAMPWLLRNSLRFRLYNSSWRGLRFGFHGEVAGAYRVFLLNILLTVITLYLAAPFFYHRLKRYQHGNTSLGKTGFAFNATLGQFYGVCLLVFAALVAAGLIFSGLAGGAFLQLLHTPKSAAPDSQIVTRLVRAFVVVVLLFSLFIGPWLQTLFANLIWNNTQIGAHRIECRQSPLRLMWIQLTNLLLLAITLGLFYPWAMVRLARFKVEAVTVIAASDLSEFEAAAHTPIGAIGEETASAFDFDIAL